MLASVRVSTGGRDERPLPRWSTRMSCAGVGDRRQPRHELRVIDARAAVERDDHRLVDQLVASWTEAGAVDVEEQLDAVDSDTHDLLPGLTR